jgi:hypothetical protein
LKSVQGELRITDNTELTRVSGLDQLTTAGQLRISNNHNLPQACVDALAGRLTAAPRATDVTGNGTGDCH